MDVDRNKARKPKQVKEGVKDDDDDDTNYIAEFALIMGKNEDASDMQKFRKFIEVPGVLDKKGLYTTKAKKELPQVSFKNCFDEDQMQLYDEAKKEHIADTAVRSLDFAPKNRKQHAARRIVEEKDEWAIVRANELLKFALEYKAKLELAREPESPHDAEALAAREFLSHAFEFQEMYEGEFPENRFAASICISHSLTRHSPPEGGAKTENSKLPLMSEPNKTLYNHKETDPESESLEYQNALITRLKVKHGDYDYETHWITDIYFDEEIGKIKFRTPRTVSTADSRGWVYTQVSSDLGLEEDLVRILEAHMRKVRRVKHLTRVRITNRILVKFVIKYLDAVAPIYGPIDEDVFRQKIPDLQPHPPIDELMLDCKFLVIKCHMLALAILTEEDRQKQFAEIVETKRLELGRESAIEIE